MRKYVVIALILLVMLVVASSFAGIPFAGKTQLTVYNEGNELLSKTYKIKTSTLLTVFFKYNGSFQKFYEKNKDNVSVRDFSCINSQIKNDIERLAEVLEYPPKEPKIVWDSVAAEFAYVEGVDGVMVDRNAIIKSLYSDFGAKTTIEIVAQQTPPKMTVDMLKEYTAERAVFSTSYARSSANRKHNIALATSRLNGLVIPTKTEFSFNKAVGPRTVSNGFLMAKIISGGNFVDGVGGGVCQVSTTLYNAWIRGSLEAINAQSHSLPVSYIGPSFDAMVSNKNDLLLFNNSENDIYLKAWTKGDRVYFAVFGKKTKETVVLRNEIVRKIPSPGYEEVDEPLIWKENETFRIISPAVDGLVSNAYKDIYVDGKLVRTEKLRTNTYLPRKGKIVRRKPDKSNYILDKGDELGQTQSNLLTTTPSLVSSKE